MIDDLKFVQGAISKKDYLPAMTHFKIKDGTITSYNGMVAISSKIHCDINCNPNAESLVKAITKCDKATQLNLTPTGRLSVKSGNFRAVINCYPEDLTNIEPEGEIIDLGGKGEKLYATLSEIYPFISEDASRPWSTGLLLRGQSCFATNNVVLLEKWLGFTIPIEVNIPRLAIKEILRVRKIPTKLQLGDASITFHYDDDKWIRTGVLDLNWPKVDDMLGQINNENLIDLDKDFFKALDKIKDFVDNYKRVFLCNNSEGSYVTTSLDIEEQSAKVEVNIPLCDSIYNIEMLSKIKTVADKIDWTTYPKPCKFVGNNLRGIILGYTHAF